MKNVGKKRVCCAACLYTVYNKNVYNIQYFLRFSKNFSCFHLVLGSLMDIARLGYTVAYL